MRRLLKWLAISLSSACVVVAGLGYLALARSQPAAPTLAGTFVRGALMHDGRARTWLTYLPQRRAPRPALVIVLHGSMGSPHKARAAFGYDFDRLADTHGFVVAYPQGVEGHWNDSRRAGDFAAKRLDIDDVGFVRALVAQHVHEHGVDAARVYVTGISNGGQMVLRLALEAPELARAYAAVASSLPAPANLAASPKNVPVSLLLMNGTADPINPWAGGEVALHGVLARRGQVLSATASVDHFRRLAGLDAAPTQVAPLPDVVQGDGSTAVRSTWRAAERRAITLLTVHRGGHGAPHPDVRGPRLLGPSNRDFHAAAEIWRFFADAP